MIASQRDGSSLEPRPSSDVVSSFPGLEHAPAFLHWLIEAIAEQVGIAASAIDPDASFVDIGLDSMRGVELAGELERIIGREFPATLAWDYPTPRALAEYLCLPTAAVPLSRRVRQAEPIAIIGMACRFPGANGLPAFWRLLRLAGDGVSEVPPDRLVDWGFGADGVSLAGGFLGDVFGFDSTFFRISPREAVALDPQQRILLELAYEAIEDARLDTAELRGSLTGVFVGISSGDWAARQFADERAEIDAYVATGASHSISANRISYAFDLRGPSLAVDTACSSSLVAVASACESLERGDATVAIAGGVNVILSPALQRNFMAAAVMSPGGRCRSFDRAADGYVRSEGAGLVVLKPLDRAKEDGDRIYAVVRGGAVNNDGRTNGLMAPNGKAQAAVLQRAYQRADVDPGSVSYVEAHGSGTRLGDAIEAQALAEVVGTAETRAEPCRLGSVKSNIGHLEAAAGVAGVIKGALMLHHGALVPTLHVEEPSADVDWSVSGLRLQREVEEWPSDERRLIGVSSFGFGGTNAHVVIEGVQTSAPTTKATSEMFALSAPTPELLREAADQLASTVESGGHGSWRDLAYAVSARPVHEQCRLAVVTDNVRELEESLLAVARGDSSPLAFTDTVDDGRRIALVCSGVGSQWPGMGTSLYAEEPIFREAIDGCDDVFEPLANWSIGEVLRNPSQYDLNSNAISQPTIFAIQVGLSDLLRSWGFLASGVVGHSLGEIAAAYIAGVLSLREAITVVHARSRLIDGLRGQGASAVVDLSYIETERLISVYGDALSIAASNSPSSTVISGQPGAIEELCGRLSERGVFARVAQLDVAAHSSQMDGIRSELEVSLGDLMPNAPLCTFASSVFGELIDEHLLDARYWRRNLREPVLFMDSVRALLEAGFDTFIELSPHPLLHRAIVEICAEQNARVRALDTLRRDRDERQSMLQLAGALFSIGEAPRWALIASGAAGNAIVPPKRWRRDDSLVPEPPPTSRESRRKPETLRGRIDGEASYIVRLDPQRDAWLADHVVEGVIVAPAAVYCTVALSAARTCLSLPRCDLVDLAFRRALVLDRDQPTTVRIDFEEFGLRGAAFRIIRDDAERPLLATGRIEAPSAGCAAPPLRTLLARCRGEHDIDDFYASLRDRGIGYGPAFRLIERIWEGVGEAVADVTGVTSDGSLDPTAVDACLQVLASAVSSGEVDVASGAYVPVRIGRLRMEGSAETVWAHASLREATRRSVSGDVVAFTDDGRVVMTVDELVLRPISAHSLKKNILDHIYEVGWQRLSEPQEGQSATRNWLLVGDDAGVADAAARTLGNKGCNCVVLHRREGDRLASTLASWESKQKNEGLGVVVCLDPCPAPQSTADVTSGRTRFTGALLDVLRTVARTKTTREVVLVTRSAVRATDGDDVEGILQSPARALGATAMLERSLRRWQSIDFDASLSAVSCGVALASELMAADEEEILAIRNGTRLGARVRRHRLSSPGDDSSMAAGTHLITGGLGSLALVTLEWLIEQGATHVALVGRRTPSEEAASAISRLATQGVEVRVVSADVADPQAVEELLANLSDMPPLSSVFHLAGILDDAVIENTDGELLRRVMAPKDAGAWNLHLATRHLPIKRFVMFSSAASVVGSPGQAAYAAANAFLDALAHHRRAQDLPGQSLNWGLWTVGGAPQDAAARLGRLGIAPITPEEAREFLSAACASDRTQLAVLPIQWDVAQRAWPFPMSSFFAEVVAQASTPPPPEGTRAVADELRVMPEDTRRSSITALVRDTLAHVLRIPTERLELTAGLHEYGLDSLQGLETKDRLESELGISLPMSSLIEEPTISDLVDLVDSLLATAVPASLRSEPLQSDVDSRFEPFPLKDIQLAYLLGRRDDFILGGVSAHVYFELETSGLDLNRLTRAFERLVARHDMLRAVILPDGRQRVLEAIPGPLVDIVDLRGWSAAEVERQLSAVREEMSHEVLPADQAPLFRVVVQLLDGDLSRLNVGADMLLVDATSMLLLARDLAQLYLDPGVELPPLEVSFRDYVLAEAALEQSEGSRAARDYWARRLESLPLPPQLPLAVDPSVVKQPRFVRRRSELDAESWARFKGKVATVGLTPSMALCSAYAEVLAAWSKSPHLCLNLTVFNRLPIHSQVNELVGDFTSLELLEVDCSIPLPFIERAKQMQHQLWEDLDHRQGSLMLLRDVARVQRGGFGMPVVFTSLLGGTFDIDWLGRQVFGLTQTPQVWLDHALMEERGNLIITWDAVEELFPAGLLDDMFDAYVELVTRLANEPEAWDQVVGGLTPASQLDIVAETNATETLVPEGLLHTPFVAWAEANPASLALATADRELSAGQVLDAVRRLSARLQALGAGSNTLVAVVMDKGWEQVVTAMAVLEAGAAYLPLDADWPSRRLIQLLELGEVSVLLTQPWVDTSIEWPEAIARIVVDEDILAGPVPASPETDVTPHDLAYVIFTSGSTGIPKGVMIEHRSALNTVVDINKRYGVCSNDSVLALSSLSFDLSVYDVFGVAAAGGTIVVPDHGVIRDPSAWARQLDQHHVTVWNTVPALAELLVDYAEPRDLVFDELRVVLLSGDWIPISLPDRLRAIAPRARIISLGGATEGSIWSIAHPIDHVDPAWASIPYGKPLANQQFHVLDARLRPCPAWVVGELFISGVGVARGYWRDPERTNESFLTHPETGERLYRTGDIGRRHPDGTIEFLGREDHQVKIRGHRIELGEIEAALATHQDVIDAVVVARNDTGGAARRVVAYLTARNRALEGAELRHYLATLLPTYMIPTAFIVLEAFPLTANGKVDRAGLPAPERAISGPGSASHTALSRRLADIVNSVVDLGDLQPDADLFDAGMDSLAAVRIANLLEQEFGTRPDLTLLFSATLRDVADTLEAQFGPIDIDEAEPLPVVKESATSPQDLSRTSMLLDSDARTPFKATRPEFRDCTGLSSIGLPTSISPSDVYKRCSARSFSAEVVELEELARLLAVLRPRPGSYAVRKHAYPSAGGIYPVRTYVHVKHGRVSGLESGLHYYHPGEHRLYIVRHDIVIDGRCHLPVNRELFEQCAFSLFLVGQMSAIEPLSGDLSRPFCLIEAGTMLQVLMQTAEPYMALTPIGTLMVDPLKRSSVLEPGEELVHSLVGGRSAQNDALIGEDMEEFEV